ncbi:hypothetical protein K492DRAFT_180452 [Lichtheimia hyalospora FSU 10163]|nr:hypothetical protein K492DRAFT_180452 [Lichtheimia hyalospora FSU 10163]
MSMKGVWLVQDVFCGYGELALQMHTFNQGSSRRGGLPNLSIKFVHHHHQQSLESHSLLWYYPYPCIDFVPIQATTTTDNSSRKRKSHPFDQKRTSPLSMNQQPPPSKKSKPSSSIRTQSSQHSHHQQHEPPPQPPSQPTFQLSYEDVSVHSLEEDLHHLQDEYATIEIILNSLRNAYPIRPIDTASEELLDEMDRELSVAYDDVKAQVRQLARSIHRLEEEIVLFLPRTPIPTDSSLSTGTSTGVSTMMPHHGDSHNNDGDDEPPLSTSMG